MLVAALCRLARRRGLSVAPFKPQNMSNNAAACADGGEIGRAQALQARAAGLEPCVDFNPVLLKPETDRRARVVVHGRAMSAMEASAYMKGGREQLLAPVLQSFERLSQSYDLVIVEGAGSPAETNLRRGDIANMGFARAAGVPVCLVGDIDRGGVIASLAGTRHVIDAEDASMIRACLINRFRGDPALFTEGVRHIEKLTGWPCLGVVPWLADCARLPAEDAVSITSRAHTGKDEDTQCVIVAPMLSRLANFDDADPLIAEPGVDFRWIPPGQAIPRDTDVVILFGSKSTTGDLDFLLLQGWHHDLHAHVRTGGRVLGLCGGYQMLGHIVDDPDGHDGDAGSRTGLGLLNVTTRMHNYKRVAPIHATCARSNADIAGYEIHSGSTVGDDTIRPMFRRPDGSQDGARSIDGRVEGSYVHGVFANDDFRRSWLRRVGAKPDPGYSAEAAVESAIEGLADGVAEAVDLDALFALAASPGWQISK